ncbi:OLC1v1008120C1 [Oldenlandia corymbosa var. corymbosa]|uniref:Hexosyltransferase n=1 Tax=Oldenlandia corymbosa var. corymbosa TaxID=529605 RepID=A0AAV1DND6_OLDCO|nr:OLC1v1008120C1 [Oldenlandia corymbosa var. corymbosa]
MDVRHRSVEDTYKRRLQKLRVGDVEKSFQITFQQRNLRYKNHIFKFILLVVILGTILGIFTSPTVYVQENLSLAVSQLLGTSDSRYISHLEINWDDVSQVLEQLIEKDGVNGIGLLNFNNTEINGWKQLILSANHTVLHLDYADKDITWSTLYPEWIDEEQETELPSCPSLPKIDVPENRLDLVAVKLPCLNNKNWMRDVPRLHLQLAAAGLVTSAKGLFPMHLLFITKCFPVPNLFPCKERVVRQGNVWLYKPNLKFITERSQLPIGSCELALPLGVREHELTVRRQQREAYATILVGAQLFVCGAIATAQSIRMAGSTKDLIALVDDNITDHHRIGLEMAGWKVRTIKGIRNPKAKEDAYNGWNYSKFRLWQLTDYDKIIYIDSDLLVLRSIDSLFTMPEITARGNHATLFNAGLMVIEPSNCTFQFLMDNIYEFDSYSGGDQGFVNEIFTWWHRMPVRMNFLKNFLPYESEEINRRKTELIAEEPPAIFVIHYLGYYKPWMCPRDFDCNWNVGKMHEFASDEAHRIWWRIHDKMPAQLQEFCMLEDKFRAQLEYDRKEAAKRKFADSHWNIVIKDPRYTRCNVGSCNINWRIFWPWGEEE